MIELQFDRFPVVRRFFEGKKQYIPALSVIHGNFPGRVFVDHEQSPVVAIAWATGRWLYSEGDITSERARSKIKKFLKEIVIPDCEENWFEIYTGDSEQWDAFFIEEIDFLQVHKHFESVYELDPEKFLQAKRSITDHLQVDFEDQGAVVRNDNQILSICKNNGFVLGNEYFIEIDTFKTENRRRGYATLAAVKLIDHFLAKGMYPLWETTHDNLPSHNLALKLGFRPIADYPVYAFVRE